MHRLVIALTTLLVLAGATTVALFVFVLGAVTDRAAAIAPAETVAYANVYLQPSAQQQTRLGNLIGRLPGFADTAALDEKIDQVAQNLLSGAGIDYREQLKPWLGDQIAVATWPGAADEPEVAAFVAVDDRDAAEAAIADVAGAPDRREYGGVTIQVTDQSSWAFVGELLVVGPTSSAVETVIDVDGGAAALADAASFRDAMQGLPTDHLASVYLDLPRLGQLSGADAELEGIGAAGAALIAEDEALRLEGSAPVSSDEAGAAPQTSTLAEWMPADTQAEITVFNLRAVLDDAERVAGETEEGRELTDTLAALRAMAAFGLGIDLDNDVLPLLAGPVALSIGQADEATPRVLLLAQPPDASGAEETLGRITDGLRGAGASVTTETVGDRAEVTVVGMPEVGELAYAVVDGLVIGGLTAGDVAAAIEAHDDGAHLAGSDRYSGAFALAGERVGHEIFVDVGALVDATGMSDELGADARDILHEIGAFALSAAPRDERLDFRAVLTVD
jgi:hypothetical protein